MNPTTTNGLRSWFIGAAIAAATCLGLPAMAQQATFAQRSITPEAALKAARAALASCQKSGYQVAVAVTDRGGLPLVMLRDRFAGPHTRYHVGRASPAPASPSCPPPRRVHHVPGSGRLPPPSLPALSTTRSA